LHDALKRSPTVTADVNRDPALDRFRIEDDRRKVEELAMMLNGLFRPERSTNIDCLVDSRSTGIKIKSHGLPFLAEPARTNAEVDAATCHQIDSCHGPRRNEGMAKSDIEDVCPQSDIFRFGAECRQHYEWIKQWK
jgi:hypothetical protein